MHDEIVATAAALIAADAAFAGDQPTHFAVRRPPGVAIHQPRRRPTGRLA
jgi:hypothetical protein